VVSRLEDIEIVKEDELGDADRAATCELLAIAFPGHAEAYASRGWRLIEPHLRMLARDGATVVAVASAFRLKSDRPLEVWGLGDGAVHPDHRRTGIGRKGILALATEVLSRKPDVVITDTAAFARISRNLGGRPVEPGEVWWEIDGERRSKPHWWMYEREPGLARPLRLEQGDF
jgi:GNAT superfamily N-acetyltransferase